MLQYKNCHIIILKKFISILCIFFSIFYILFNPSVTFADENDNVKSHVENIFLIRNKAILTQDLDSIQALYNTDIKFGQWAYEYEQKKIKYINNWAEKQGVKFIDIIPNIIIKKIVPSKNKDKYSLYIMCNTEYKYIYPDDESKVNSSRIGTYHSMQLSKENDEYIITKEWYTDPFADSLNLEHINSKEIKSYILSQGQVQFDLSDRQKKAVDYAHKYCGAATNVDDKIYLINPNYKDFNSDGGDCANFASQIMYESGTFSKNPTWNYENGAATKAWVNAQGFKNYLVYSGRGYYLAKGSYEEVYKEAYKLRPGDIVGYEKNGRITHVSTVTGLDSRGYPLVTCHNTDRLLVPWDLGWSDKKIGFHLIKVNY